MNAPNVLHAPIETDAYRCAVATIIRDIQRSLRKSLVEIAEDIDVSLGTISNAVNGKADLNATYLARLGAKYGGAFLNPYLNLFDVQAAPIKRRPHRDILPILTLATHEIAKARDPGGPGGATEVPQERRGYLPKLKEVQHEVGCLISEIEAI